MVDKEYLDSFEKRLEESLLRLCTSYGVLERVLLSSADIDDRWIMLAPEYVADAVLQVSEYPTVSVAWAAYLGMAVANGWDTDWEHCSAMSYKEYYGEDGFDDMDEHIVRDVLGLPLDGTDARALETVVRACAQNAVGLIRHEQIEPQSPMAFHVFSRAAKVMFRIGAAIELKRLGYNFVQEPI